MTTVNVTQEHIDQGHQCDTAGCPVALAMIEAFGLGEEDLVCAGPYQLGIRRQGELAFRWLDTPFQVATFMETYDATEPVQPFSFELDWSQARTHEERLELR